MIIKSEDLKAQFLELMEKHQGVIHHICALYTNDEEDRKDMFQEVLLQLWKSFQSFKHESKFSTWLYRVALNTAISHLRKKRPLRFSSLSAAENIAIEPFQSQDDDIKEMNKAIRMLNKIERAIVLLYLEERTYDEIAEIIGITSNNVGVRINRIKSKLEKLMTRG